MTDRKRRGFAIRLCITAGALFVLFQALEFKKVVRTLAAADLRYVTAALLIALALRLAMAWKWKILLEVGGITLSPLEVLRLTFIADFVGLMVPTSLGFDAARLAYLKRKQLAFTPAAGAILADRIVALLTMVSISMAAVLFGISHHRDHQFIVALVSILFAASWVAALIILSQPALSIWQRMLLGVLELLPPGKSWVVRGISAILRSTEAIHRQVRMSLSHLPLISRVVALAVLVVAGRIALVHMLLRTVGASIPHQVEIACVPLINLMAMLPLSVLGLGIKEVGFVYFFSGLGTESEVLLSASLLTHVLQLVAICGGGLACMYWPQKCITGSPLRKGRASSLDEYASEKPQLQQVEAKRCHAEHGDETVSRLQDHEVQLECDEEKPGLLCDRILI